MANDRGHLLPGIDRSKRSPFGEFLGTWDLPKRIPGPYHVHPMGRTDKNFSSLCAQRDQTIREMEQARVYAVGSPIFHPHHFFLFSSRKKIHPLVKHQTTTMNLLLLQKKDFYFSFPFLSLLFFFSLCLNALTGLNFRAIHMFIEFTGFL